MLSTGGTTTIGLYDFKRKVDTFGGVYYWEALQGGYLLNARVMLINGNIVKSTVANNTANPNVDMTGWKFNDNTIESIAELLAINNPKHGQVVDVASYYVNENKGGDKFRFNSLRISENNGVTVFNGWVRDLSDKVLTTDDAGLVDNDGTDQKVKLQAIATVLSGTNSFTFKIIGKHLTTTNIEIKNAVGLKVVGKGEISAKELRDQWTFLRTSGVRGVLYFEDCPYLTVSNSVKLTGAKKQYLTAPEPWEDGDCPIHLNRCPHSLIDGSEFSHSVAWGVLAENSPYTIVNNNDIYDIVRQSGVNIVVGGGTKCKVTNNRIRDVGLYGVEWETYNDCEDFEESGNVVWDCQKGSALVGHLVSGNVHNNVYKFCNEGITAYPLLTANRTKQIKVHNNQVFGSVIGYYSVNSNDVLFEDNIASMKVVNDYYFRASSHDSVLAVESTTQILVLPSSTFAVGSSGTQINIHGVLTTIASVTSIDDNRLSTTTLKRIVLSSPVSGITDGDAILTYEPFNLKYRGLFSGGGNTSTVFKENTVIGYYTAQQSDSTYVSDLNQELFINNTAIDCTLWLSVQLVTQGVKVKNTNRINSNDIIINSNSLAKTLIPTTHVNVENTTPRATGTQPKQYFSLPDAKQLIGCIVSFDDSVTSTSDVVVKVDGVDSFTIPSGEITATNKSFLKYGISNLAAGSHSIQISDTLGDLTYQKWSVELLFV